MMWLILLNVAILMLSFWLSLTYARAARYRVIERLIRSVPSSQHGQAILDAGWFSSLLTEGEVVRIAEATGLALQWPGGGNRMSKRRFCDPFRR